MGYQQRQADTLFGGSSKCLTSTDLQRCVFYVAASLGGYKGRLSSASLAHHGSTCAQILSTPMVRQWLPHALEE